MADRLSIINDALLGTGNNRLNVEYDGSDAWTVAESAYRRSVGYLTDKHDWKFATRTVPLVGLLPLSPHPLLSKAYALPDDCLHVVAVWIGLRGGPGAVPLNRYEIVDDRLCCDHDAGLTIEYVRAPDPTNWPAGFVEICIAKVEAYLLQGLNEDTDNARRRHSDVEDMLAELRTRHDQQTPARAILRSPSAERRAGGRGRIRLPVPPYGGVGR